MRAARNDDIYARHSAGELLKDLAREYGISQARTSQIYRSVAKWRKRKEADEWRRKIATLPFIPQHIWTPEMQYLETVAMAAWLDAQR
jgi:hypothetical protein